MRGREEFRDWASGEVEHPRRGWFERLLWTLLLLTLIAVPVMCTVESAGWMLRF